MSSRIAPKLTQIIICRHQCVDQQYYYRLCYDSLRNYPGSYKPCSWASYRSHLVVIVRVVSENKDDGNGRCTITDWESSKMKARSWGSSRFMSTCNQQVGRINDFTIEIVFKNINS